VYKLSFQEKIQVRYLFQFQAYWYNICQGENIAVDESLIMMLYKGRVQVKLFISNQRAWFDLKLYELGESGLGYIWNTIIHTGRADQMELTESTDGLVSSRIVLTFVEPLLDHGCHLYMDNFYASPALYLQWFLRGTYAVGTVRTGRHGMPAGSLRTKIRTRRCTPPPRDDGSKLAWQKGSGHVVQ